MKRAIVAIAMISIPWITNFAQQLQLVTGDLHQHTSFSDGWYKIDYMMSKNNQYGLDWWVINDHGGGFIKDGRTMHFDEATQKTTEAYWDQVLLPVQILGTAEFELGHKKMWRWQALIDYSFPKILEARNTYSNKTIIQGFEMFVPGHQHASISILTNQFGLNANINSLAEFEYKFDDKDIDMIGGAAKGWTKSILSGHQKAIESIKWLQKNHRLSSWFIPAHPDWLQPDLGYSISSFRDMNNAGPDVCFGFEGMPGCQKSANRGGYGPTALGGGTYGGVGYYSATVGGLWDALLSEGRHWWLFADSDLHGQRGDFYPGEYQKNYTWVTDKHNPQAIINGLRSGNTFIVSGDLIDHLEFSANDSLMGHTVIAEENNVAIRILVHDPQGANNNTYSGYTNPLLDHIDLIAGQLNGIVAPNNPDYNNPTVSTTKVVARFDAWGNKIDNNNLQSIAWNDLGDGWKEVLFDYPVTSNIYFRLRGTNLGLGITNETDANGNPLPDFLMGPNNGPLAFNDLWFYSNPIFVDTTTNYNPPTDSKVGFTVYPNPSLDGHFHIKTTLLAASIQVYDMAGQLVFQDELNGLEDQLDLSNLSKGIYIVNLTVDNYRGVQKVVIK